MTNNQKEFLQQLVQKTNWQDADEVKSASEQLIEKFRADYPVLDESKAESIQQVMYEGLYAWLDCIMDCLQEQRINGTSFWDNMLTKVNAVYTRGIGFMLANYIVFAQAARQYSKTKDCEHLQRTLSCMSAFCFEKHAPYSLSVMVDDLCEKITRIIFANTFIQLDMQLFVNEALNADGKKYIDKMKHSRVINSFPELIAGIANCEAQYPNL